MKDELNVFAVFNGVPIRVKTLIEMAKNAGDYSMAQPFLVTLLYYANIHHLNYINDEVDKIRKHYNLAPFPALGAPASGNNMPNFETPQKKQAEIARGIYCQMIKEQREDVLKEALAQLFIEKENLFVKNACWIGIYLVVKDRLDEDLKMQGFCTYSITPEGWPSKLTISPKSLSNIRRYIKGKDQFQPYYLMEENPFKDLCNKFWEILLGLILMRKSSVK